MCSCTFLHCTHETLLVCVLCSLPFFPIQNEPIFYDLVNAEEYEFVSEVWKLKVCCGFKNSFAPVGLKSSHELV